MVITHQPERQRFISVVDGHESVADYRRSSGKVDFNLRGRGIAEKLVREALSWARAEDLQIEASCWYVRRFL